MGASLTVMEFNPMIIPEGGGMYICVKVRTKSFLALDGCLDKTTSIKSEEELAAILKHRDPRE